MRHAILLLTVFAAAATVSGKAGPNTALRLDILPSRFERVAVVPGQVRCPPSFALALTLRVPTPGWQLQRDKVIFQRDERRVLVRCTKVAPTGMVAQVVCVETYRVELGVFAKGNWAVEVQIRESAAAPYKLYDAFVLKGS